MEKQTGFLNGIEPVELLNTVGESVILTDLDLNIQWFNQTAGNLLDMVVPHIDLEHSGNLIGMNLKTFHKREQIRKIEESPLPYIASIQLFETFSAQIVLDKLPLNRGFILTWKDVTGYETAIRSGRKLMEELYTPIIGTMLDHTFLAAVTGFLSEQRVEYMSEKILLFAAEKKAEHILFDFSEMYAVPDEAVTHKLQQLVKALELMGTESICVGLKPEMARHIIQNGYGLSIKAFSSFKQGIQYIWDKEGYKLVKV